ncbi:putative reverse transcriptase domain-containing protein [Tanacetum coccineum]
MARGEEYKSQERVSIGSLEDNFVMLESEDSTITYIEVSSLFKDLSDIGSSGVDGLPMMPEDPYAYVEAALQAPPSPDYVTDPEHPPSHVYVPYVPEPFDPEEDLEEGDEDPEEDPADYPTDRGDNDEEEESFGDDADDEEEDKDEDEEEEDHLALTDSVPPPTCRTTARMSIGDQTPIPFLSAAEVDRFLAISTSPPSPLTLYSSPLPQIPSPPLPVSLPLHVSSPPLLASPTYHLGYKAVMIRLRAKSPSTSHPLPSSTSPSGTPPLLHIPLPTPSPPLLLPSTVCRASVFEVTLPPRKRLCIALGPRFKVGESSSAPTARPTRGFRADYRFVITLDDEIRRDPERGRQDTDKIYGRLDDAQNDRSLMSGQVNMLRRDRRAHARTARLMDSEARLSRKAWVQSMDASDTAHFEMAVLQSQQTPAREPARPEIPEEACSSSMFPEESDKIKKYVSGLPEMIHESVMASKPKTMQDAIEFATELMDKKIRTFAERQSENKRKQDDNQQQQQNKRQNTGKAYAIGSTANANTANNQRGIGTGQKPTCYECRAQGHFKREFPKLKNNNHGNQGGNGNAPVKVYAVGRAGTNPDSNVITGTFLLNNLYASVLFDTGADRSFVSTAFSSQINITPSTLDHYYDVELADGRIIGLNAII